jgi:hypothetical protein
MRRIQKQTGYRWSVVGKLFASRQGLFEIEHLSAGIGQSRSAMLRRNCGKRFAFNAR